MNYVRGQEISRTKLEMDGYYKIYNFGYSCKVFAKDNHRIILDTNRNRIVELYNIH